MGRLLLQIHVSVISLSLIFCLKAVARFYDFDYIICKITEIYLARQITLESVYSALA